MGREQNESCDILADLRSRTAMVRLKRISL